MAVQGSPFPLCVTKENGIVGIFPFDAVSWTEPTSQVFAAMTAAAKEHGATGSKLFAITGTATPLAKKNLAALGGNCARISQWLIRREVALPILQSGRECSVLATTVSSLIVCVLVVRIAEMRSWDHFAANDNCLEGPHP